MRNCETAPALLPVDRGLEKEKKKRKEKAREEGEEEGMARRAESWRNNRQTVTPEVPIVLLVDWAEARVYVGACSGLARRLYR